MENFNKTAHIKSVEKIEDTPETSEIQEKIKDLEENFLFVGEGGNAIVYTTENPAFEKFCFKQLRKNPQLNCNDIYREHDLQVKATEQGVRTPLILLAIETDENEKYIIMKKVNGHSVKDVLANNNLLATKFNYETFCKSLDEQIAKLHNKGKMTDGIYHRDLHLGNIMIDEEGLPVIIDFGTATEGTGSDFTYEESVEMYNPKTKRYEMVNGYFKDDIEMIKNIKASLKQFIMQKVDL